MKKLILGAVAGLFLSGCAQMQQQKMAEQSRIDETAVRAECDAVLHSSELMPLNGFIPILANQASLQQLSDPSTPNDAQKAALSELDRTQVRCLTMQRAWIAKYHGQAVAAAYDTYTQKVKGAMAALWASNMSFGQFNTARAGFYSEMASTAATIEQQAQQQQAALDQSRRQAALQYLQTNAAIQQAQANQFYQQQQQQLQMQRPITTTCNSFIPNQLNCTTR